MSNVFGGFFDNPRLDFKKINKQALNNAESVLRHFIPGGKIIRSEYVVLNPRRSDKKAGSFKINITRGCWADFATGDRGGDLISLVAFIQDVSQSEAARLLASMLGIPAEVQ